MTTRLLVIGDAGGNTGFEQVVRGISTHLHGTGNYDITVRGIGYYRDTASRQYPYTVKGVGGTSADPLGIANLPKWIREDRPDALLVVQDLWNITGYMGFKPRDLPTVAYFPVDTPNMKPMHCLGLGAVSEAVAYTQFGAMEAAAGVRGITNHIFAAHQDVVQLNESQLGWACLPKDGMKLHIRFDRLAKYQNPTGFHVVPHGTEPGKFEPRDKLEARAIFGLPADAFIVSNINTNQFRKRQDLTLRAFKLLVDIYPKAFLVLHCAGGDRDGWDLLDLVHYLEIPTDRVACVHYSSPELTDDALCWLYNTADVNINTSGGEGWALTTSESAACGVPQLAPDWSATRELWSEHGVLLPVKEYRTEPKRLNTMHAEIDVKDAANYLYEFATKPHWLEWFGSKALEFAAAQQSWDAVGATFDGIIQKALSEAPINTLTKAELLAGREPNVRSELAGKPVLEGT